MSVKKVLVVDDSPTERHAISEILRKAGFNRPFTSAPRSPE